MNEFYIRNVIEAALLAAGGPLPVAELLRLFDDSVRPGAQAVREALDAGAVLELYLARCKEDGHPRPDVIGA